MLTRPPQIVAFGGAALHFVGTEPAEVVSSRPTTRARSALAA